MTRSRSLLFWVFVLMVLAGVILSALILGCHLIVNRVSSDYCYASPEHLPPAKVGVLLGISRFTAAGTANPYYLARLEAARELFARGKIQSIIVSGYKATHGYDEPRAMRDDLIRQGIPAERIVRDDFGDRTFDSMVRVKKVFRIDSCIVISQQFHIERAVYIGRRYGLAVEGFAARDIPEREGYGKQLRELLARVRAVLDVEILHSDPSYVQSLPDQEH